MTSLASSPGTAVDPMCETSVATPLRARAAPILATTRSPRSPQSARGPRPLPARRDGCVAVTEVGGIRLDALAPQGIDVLLELLRGAAVVDEHVGDGAALGVRGLRGDARAGIGLVEAPLLDETPHPRVGLDVDDDVEVLVHPQAALHEQGHVEDRDAALGGRRDAAS